MSSPRPLSGDFPEGRTAAKACFGQEESPCAFDGEIQVPCLLLGQALLCPQEISPSGHSPWEELLSITLWGRGRPALGVEIQGSATQALS